MQYDTLLFDIDNTLLDFEADESQALKRLFDFVGIELTTDLHQKYSTYNQSLWRKLERNEITREELLATRFNVFFKENFNRDVTDLNLNDRYINYLSDGHDLCRMLPNFFNCSNKTQQFALKLPPMVFRKPNTNALRKLKL